MKKRCCICKLELDLDNFAYNKSKKDCLQSQCKNCQKDYRKKHYISNRKKYIDKSKRLRKKYRKQFYSWMQDKYCKDCGNSDFRVLEFDHLEDKKYNISERIGAQTLESLMIEINKCDIVCANCHRIRTCKQFDYYKDLNDE